MSVASIRIHTDGVLAALVAALSSTTVGDAEKPSGGGWGGTPGQSVHTGYAILYQVDVEFDGSLAAPDDDADVVYQVTCVGETRMQAEWVLDKAVTALDQQRPAITGRAHRQPVELTDGSGGVRRDDTVDPPVFLATPRFTVRTTPSS